uniref:Putative YadA domain-containing structural protein n=1 Tax=viral metagenome TaxID=1070528 RepID=A0A6M3XY61_9ZZZZ
MKRWILFILFLPVICNAQSINVAGSPPIGLAPSGGSSEWTLSGTGITPTTADVVSNPGSYTSTASTGVFQFGTQAAIGATYSPVTGGGRIGIGTTAPSEAAQISGTVLIGGDGVPGTSKYRLKFGTGGTVWMNETYADILSIGASSAEWYIGTTTGVKGITGNAASGAMLINETPSATNPGFGFQGDPDTGMGRSSADVLHMITGGATAMTYSYAAAGPSIGLGKNMSIILASGSGPFMGYSATALSPMPYSGTAGFYAADSGGGTVKMYAADDAGGTAALTPHANYEDWDLMAPETDNPYPFLQGPFQQRALGVEVVYDVERMAIAMAAFADGKPCPYPPGTKFVHWRKLPDDKQIDLKELKKKAWKNNWIKDNTTDEVIPTDEQSEAAAISGFTFSNPAGINLDWEAK